jgi:hypothetical protein
MSTEVLKEVVALGGLALAEDCLVRAAATDYRESRRQLTNCSKSLMQAARVLDRGLRDPSISGEP